MKIEDRNQFVKESRKILEEMWDMMAGLPALQLKELDGSKTALVIVDMINGFAREGMLKSERVEALIPEIVQLSKKCDAKGISKLAFADCHTEVSPEFGAYPVHCLANTSESDVVEEIRKVGGYQLIPKNSTNGFLEPAFMQWLDENSQKDTFIVVGDCTDICVQQFATTLKTWFNRRNLKSRVVVPVNAVDTYDLGLHQANLLNVTALYNMAINGVELVAAVK